MSIAAHRGIETLAAKSRLAANDTLRTIEDAIKLFSGCAIVISNDRWFLDRVATHSLAFEGESKVTFFDGTAWAGVRGRDAGSQALG